VDEWGAAPAPAQARPAAVSTVSDEDFALAIENDDLATVSKVIAQDKSRAVKLLNEDTPLSLASSIQVANVLIAAGASVNAVSPETGETPIFAVNNPELVYLLFSKGADFNHQNADGLTALKVFTEDGNAAMVEALTTLSKDFASLVESDNLKAVNAYLARDSKVAGKEVDGEFPLALVSSVEMAEALLRAGASVNTVNTETGETPLFGISVPSLVSVFVKHGANLQHKNKEGQTAEDIFAEDGNDDMVHALRAFAPAPKAASPTKAAPAKDFIVVVEEDDVAVARSMLAQNRALATTTSADGDLPLGLSPSVAMASLLLDHGANVNATNPATGETALFCINNPELVHLFVSKGADVYHKNAEGSTALDIFTEDENEPMCAAIRNATPAIRVSPEQFLELVENDRLEAVRAALAGNPTLANTAPVGDAMYPLSVASSVPVATLLLDAKADVNAVLNGETALMCISNPALVPLLVSRGANLNFKNDDGETALDIFTADSNDAMIEALREAGAGASAW